MYGTVATFRVIPGKEAELIELARSTPQDQMPGFVTEYIYRLDRDASTFVMAVVFENREAYHANAARPAQHALYLKFRELLVDDPDWQDGEIVFTQ